MNWSINEKGFIFDFSISDVNSDYMQRNKLEEFLGSNFAEELSEDKYLIEHDKIAQLFREERELLDLPEIFPYRLRLKMHGSTTNKNMRYIVEFVRPDGQVFVNPQVIGSYVRISSELQYTFNQGQYVLVTKTAECNKKLAESTEDFDYKQFNFMNLAGIKEVANSLDAEIDSEIKKQNIIVPKALSILPEFKDNGDIIIKPVIMNEKGEMISEYEEFNKRFTAANSVRTVYSSGEAFYVIPNPVKEALDEVKANNKIKAARAKDFLKNPEAIFKSSAFVFNIDEYSERVIELGEYKYRNERNSASGIDWLPEEGTAFKGMDNSILRVTSENIEEVAEKIKEAQSKGESVIEIDGREIPITIEIIKQVENLENKKEKLAESQNDNDETRSKQDNQEADANAKKEKRKILIIADNFENVNYGNNSKSRVLEPKDLDACLRDEIKLLNHQKDGVKWLLERYANDDGALLADDMGLGKTLQTLTFISLCKKFNGSADFNSVLIVAPVSLLKNWEEEYKKFIRDGVFDGVVVIDNKTVKNYQVQGDFNFTSIAKNKIVVVSYETLRTYQLAFGKIEWSIMVLDEAQKIKNPVALTTIAIKAMKYDFGLCLTGTPIENTWVDLWSIMDFASPGGKLGSLTNFKKDFVHKLKKDKSDMDAVIELGQKLHETLEPLFMRRMKHELCNNGGDLAGLPKKLIQKTEEVMPLPQKIAYAQVIENARYETSSKATALKVIGQLRDVSLYPDIASLDERHIDKIDPAKIINSSARLKATFTELVKIATRNEKALIFSESRKMQKILKVIIEKVFNISVATPINGEMNSEYRQKVVDKFNAEQGFAVLVLSPLAAGVGLNIASANHVIHLSRHWNPAKEDQATDRAYRIGQTKDVEVCIPMAVHPDFGENGTFDKKLDQLLEYKRQLSYKVLIPTADDEEDGLGMFKAIMGDPNGELRREKLYYDINEIDHVEGKFFEKIIEKLYCNMDFEAWKTPDSNDNGADVVAISKNTGNNFLIQCKKTGNIENNLGKEGIYEVSGALPCYKKELNKTFVGVVITNATDFTKGAKELANANGIKLIVRKDLKKLLEKYPVEKLYV